MLCRDRVGQGRENFYRDRGSLGRDREGAMCARQNRLGAHDRPWARMTELRVRQGKFCRDRLGQGWPPQKIMSPTIELGVRRPTHATVRIARAIVQIAQIARATEAPCRAR